MRNVELEEPAEEEFAQYVETDMMHWKVGILLGKQTRSEWWNTLDQQIPEWNDDRVPTIEDLKIVLQHFGLRFPNIRASSIQWGRVSVIAVVRARCWKADVAYRLGQPVGTHAGRHRAHACLSWHCHEESPYHLAQ